MTELKTTHNIDKLEASQGFYRVHALTAVHKRDADGVLLIDTLTGEIKQPIDERPSWAGTLAVAHLAERVSFYSSRLGPDYTKAFQFPQMLAFEDLAWEVVNEDGEFQTILADDEMRMEVIAEWAGVIRQAEAADKLRHVPDHAWKVTGDAFISHDADDHIMTENEARAFEDAEKTTFGRQAEIDAFAPVLEEAKRKAANG